MEISWQTIFHLFHSRSVNWQLSVIISDFHWWSWQNYRLWNYHLKILRELSNIAELKKWSVWEVCRGMSTYSNAHAKVQNLIFGVQFTGNWFGFGILGKDFWSSTISAFQILLSFSSKILKTLEINLVIRSDQILNRWSRRISRYPSLILSNFAFAVSLISPITTNDYIHLMKYYGFCKDILHINLEHYHYLQKLWFSSNINIP